MQTTRAMSNLEIAKLLRSISAALSIKPGDNLPAGRQDRFRIIAYDRAADAVEHSSSEVKDLWDEGKLDSLAGIGTSIAAHLDELFKTGKVKHFEDILKGLPEAMFELMDIPGLGPKNAYRLSKELGITRAHGAVEKLQKAAEKGRIREIEGFGEESEKNILENIGQVKKRSGRVLLPTAAQSAEPILEWLKKNPHVKAVEPLGSLRRRVSTIGDVDIAVASNKPAEVISHFINFPKKSRIIEKGESTAAILLANGLHIDLMVQSPDRFGALLQHFTGSKHHNIALREYAVKKGLSLSERGIKVKGDIKNFATEEAFYRFLGMDWIPPEIREDTGEIISALNHKLPQLIETSNIQGDLHLHSDFNIEPSHDLGTSSVEEYVQMAKPLGYEYLGFAEHNPSVSQHSQSQIIELLKKKQSFIEHKKSSAAKRGLYLLNGLEIDIRSDGSLAIPDNGFDYLDYAIVSIHSSFKGGKADQTKRVLQALSYPKARILGHPTARKLNEREGVDLDWDKIFDYCLKNNKILEINGYYDRLDLPDVLVREAVKRGVKMIIDTDSHQAATLELIEYGVSVARRGWAEKSDIINSQPWSEFKKTILSQND